MPISNLTENVRFMQHKLYPFNWKNCKLVSPYFGQTLENNQVKAQVNYSTEDADFNDIKFYENVAGAGVVDTYITVVLGKQL